MKYPEFLPENGTIGFVAPSFGCSIEPYHTAFLNAQKKFTGLGHRLELGPNCYASEGIGISNTPEACGAELTEYYCSDKNDILTLPPMCARQSDIFRGISIYRIQQRNMKLPGKKLWMRKDFLLLMD